MSIAYAQKQIRHFCYCVSGETEHKYIDRFESADGDAFKYKCTNCNAERVIDSSDLEVLLNRKDQKDSK